MGETTIRKALLVDDEHDMLTLLAKVLTRKCGCTVTTATSAEEALALVRADPPEVVLTDIKMPGMDGLELLRQLGSVTPAVTTILMTGHGTIDMAVQALKDGAYDFIEKPFDNERIIRTVLRAIERTRLLRENLQLQHRLGEEGDLLGFVGRSRRLLRDRGPAPAGGAEQRHRAHPRRVRHRQGAGGPGPAHPVRPGANGR